MMKKLFLAMGVVFACIIAGFLLLGLKAVSDASQNKIVAETITRDMARAWEAKDLKPHFVRIAADRLNFDAAQVTFNKMKPFGPLKRIEQSQQTAFKTSVGEASTATIAMVAEFANGRANVTIDLRSEGGEMKLWNVNVVPIGTVRAQQQI